MLEHFTQSARDVVIASVEEAEQRRDRHVGTEHLLLGLARTEAPVVVATLRNFSIDVTAVRAALDDEDISALAAVGVDLDPHLVDVGRPAVPRVGGWIRRFGLRDHRPFTGGAKQVLVESLQEAKGLGHRYLGPEHILLALTERSTRDPGLSLLERLGTDPAALRRELMSRMSRAAS